MKQITSAIKDTKDTLEKVLTPIEIWGKPMEQGETVDSQYVHFPDTRLKILNAKDRLSWGLFIFSTADSTKV